MEEYKKIYYNGENEKDEFINMLYVNRYSGVTYEQIEDRFGWQRKTIERRLNNLEDRFGSALKREYIKDGSHKKIFRLVLPDVNKLPPTLITSSDIACLRTGAAMIKNNAVLAKGMIALADKLENVNKHATIDADDIIEATGTVSIAGPKIQVDKVILQTLQNAILGCNVVEIVYNGKTSTMCPLGILYGIHNNYLVAAHPRHIKKPIKYTLRDIKDVRILDTVFDAGTFNMSEYVKQSFGVFIENDHGFDVEWRVLPSAVADAKKYMFHPNQQLIDNPDGTMTVKFHACGLREMAWHIFTWGGTIIPVAPRELVRTYKDFIKKATDSLKK